MSTVLVPLNETGITESILPDAQQLAGSDGTVVLVFVVPEHRRGMDMESEQSDAERYLDNESQLLAAHGFHVKTRILTGGDIPHAIDTGVTALGADFVAAAIVGMGSHERLARSSIAWKTLAHSSVPILLRHVQPGRVLDLEAPSTQSVKIMVPLDGSERAAAALLLATSLATQWKGSLVLVQIAPHARGGQEYLDELAHGLTVPVQTHLGHGSAADGLVQVAGDQQITHVVMTSHGRTGLARAIAGDVAADLIERLVLPIIVIPVLAQREAKQTVPKQSETVAPGSTSDTPA